MKLQEESYDANKGGYTINMRDACEQVGGSDTGNALYLFSTHWNDVQDEAPNFGIGFNSKGEVVDLPPKPDLKFGEYAVWNANTDSWKIGSVTNPVTPE